MNVRIYGISDQATLDPLGSSELSAAWQLDEIHRWIDIEASTQEELRQLLAPLNLHTTILEACLKPERSSRLISHRAALYMELPTHLSWDQTEKPYLSILCLKTTIITIHRDLLHTIEDIMEGLDAEVPLYAQSSSALLHYLLVQINTHNVDAVLGSRTDAERLDMECHNEPDSLDPDEITALRRRVSHYSAVHDDHTYCAGLLQTVESDAFRFSEQSKHFHELLELSELTQQIIDGAESRVAGLQRDYELSVQKKVESRLQLLTILSAVFLPLTLISGIYGMNFNDMPGMGLSYGYIVVMAIMMVTATSIGIFLFRRGWF